MTLYREPKEHDASHVLILELGDASRDSRPIAVRMAWGGLCSKMLVVEADSHAEPLIAAFSHNLEKNAALRCH